MNWIVQTPGGVVNSGTARGGTSTSITLAATASMINDRYNGNTVRLADGRERVVSDYDGSTQIATIGERWRTNLQRWSEALENGTENNVTVTADQDRKSVV